MTRIKQRYKAFRRLGRWERNRFPKQRKRGLARIVRDRKSGGLVKERPLLNETRQGESHHIRNLESQALLADGSPTSSTTKVFRYYTFGKTEIGRKGAYPVSTRLGG